MPPPEVISLIFPLQFFAVMPPPLVLRSISSFEFETSMPPPDVQPWIIPLSLSILKPPPLVEKVSLPFKLSSSMPPPLVFKLVVTCCGTYILNEMLIERVQFEKLCLFFTIALNRNIHVVIFGKAFLDFFFGEFAAIVTSYIHLDPWCLPTLAANRDSPCRCTYNNAVDSIISQRFGKIRCFVLVILCQCDNTLAGRYE
jgi:hypothetical protein